MDSILRLNHFGWPIYELSKVARRVGAGYHELATNIVEAFCAFLTDSTWNTGFQDHPLTDAQIWTS
jgi:hypothetical protein